MLRMMSFIRFYFRLLQISKRRRLNEVETLLILKFDQLKHANDIESMYDVLNAILVDEDIIRRLDMRPMELEQEIVQEQKEERYLGWMTFLSSSNQSAQIYHIE